MIGVEPFSTRSSTSLILFSGRRLTLASVAWLQTICWTFHKIQALSLNDLEWTWYLRSLSSLSAWSTLYTMPFESFKQFPAPWLVAPYDMVDVGRGSGRGSGRWEIPKDSLFPRVGVAGVVWQRWGGFCGVFSWHKTRCFCKTDDFLLELFEKAPNIVAMIMFQQTCSIPKMLSHPLVKTKNDLLFQKGKSGREAERFLEPLPIGSLVMHKVNNIPTIWSVYNLPFSLLDLSMIMSNLCSMSFINFHIPRLLLFVVRLGLGLPGSCDIALLHLGFHVFHVDAESVQWCPMYRPCV